MTSIIVIPCRLASSRFPGKPLADVDGRSLLWHTATRARESKADHVIVASADEMIRKEVASWNGVHATTREDHPTGTHRCAEVLDLLPFPVDVVINLQVDEPAVPAEWLNRLIDAVSDTKIITTLAARRDGDRNQTRVMTRHQRAVWFSKSVGDHVGVYGFTADLLWKVGRLLPTLASQEESLEQLAWLEAGYEINVMDVDWLPPSINVPGDLDRYRGIL